MSMLNLRVKGVEDIVRNNNMAPIKRIYISNLVILRFDKI